jgi:Bacterial SH3 domain
MNMSEVRQSVLTWTEQDPMLSFLGGDAPGPAGPPFALPIRVDGDPAVDVEVVATEGADQVLVRGVVDIPEENPGAAPVVRDLGRGRHGPLALTLDGRAIRAAYPCYLDGFGRQDFMVAVTEVAKTVRVAAGVLRGVPRMAPEPRAVEPAPAASPVATVQPGAPTQPVPAAAPAPVAASAAQAWRATHVAGRGMRAWAAPDPSRPPITDLAPGVELRVLEALGDWARVDASNGWTGWVDARLLVAKT